MRQEPLRPRKSSASNRTPEKAECLAEATGIRPANSRVVAELSDVIFVCVRPLEVRDVLSELADQLDRQKLVISVAADVSLKIYVHSARPAWLVPFPA